MSIDAKNKPIDEIFSKGCEFIVPLFQRKYVWDEPEWKQLWNDLYDHFLKYSTTDLNRKYPDFFLGTIVLQDIEEKSDELDKLLVIDGQQRLITLSIIFAVIRDYIVTKKSCDDPAYMQLDTIKHLLFNNHESQHYKILVSEVNKKDYINILDRTENIHQYSKNNIIKCYFFFKNKFELFHNEIEITGFLHSILHHINIVYITIDSITNPYMIFQSLNHLGKPLSQIDLIRNFIFMKIKSDEDARLLYLKYWKPLEDSYDGNYYKMENFIKQFLKSRGLDVTNNDKIYSTIFSLYNYETEIKVTELINELFIYHIITEKYLVHPHILEIEGANGKNLQQLKNGLFRIKILQFSALNALVMNYAHMFEACIQKCENKSELNDAMKNFFKIIHLLETFVIRNNICNNSRKNEEFLTKIAGMMKSDMINDSYPSLSLTLLKEMPNNLSFINSLKYLPIYRQNRRITEFILKSIEYDLSKGETNVWYDSSISVEHIMPQNIDSSEEWQKMLGKEYHTIHREWLHRLGNLTITDNNSGLSNFSYDKKVENYFSKSNYQITKNFVENYDIWNEESLNKRSDSLVKKALKIWSLPKIGNNSHLNQHAPKIPTDIISVLIRAYSNKPDVSDDYQVSNVNVDSNLLSDIDLIHMSPKSFTFFKDTVNVKYWSEIQKLAINLFYKYEENLFIKFAEENDDIINKNGEFLNNPVQIDESDWYYEKIADPSRIRDFVMRIISYLPDDSGSCSIIYSKGAEEYKLSLR